MKIDTPAATQSIHDYLDGEISGVQLSDSLSQVADGAKDLDKKQMVSLKYYIGFFKKEGNNLYLHSNKYLKEEVDELGEFFESLSKDQQEQLQD